MHEINTILPTFESINEQLLALIENDYKHDCKKNQALSNIQYNVETFIIMPKNSYIVTYNYLLTLNNLCDMYHTFCEHIPLLDELDTLCYNIRYSK